MTNTIIEEIMRHLETSEAALTISNVLLTAAMKEQLNVLEVGAENRERVIQILNTQQASIETKIDNLNASDIDTDFIEIIKQWSTDVQRILISIENVDIKLLEVLKDQKFATTEQIASLYKSKSALKGYNLNNVSK